MAQRSSTSTAARQYPLEERILHVFRHLGIEQAHIAALMPSDWIGLTTQRAAAISSLILVCPELVDHAAVHQLASRLLVVSGDQSWAYQQVAQAMRHLPDATLVTLPGYAPVLWTDVLVDRTREISAAIIDFLGKMSQVQGATPIALTEQHGEVAGITYAIRGAGPPLVLLPLGLAPSQWDPLLARLSEDYCTIVLRGPELGIMPVLEARGRSTGYVRLIRNMITEIQLTDGEMVLDVGCGSGVVDRWLARHTGGRNRIVGVDLNAYLLAEAVALAKKEGFNEIIEFQAGNAESLIFSNDSFDVTLSTTVMEEVDADKMLSEMIRVTKPGGRIGVIVRALDMPRVINVPLSTELKAKLEIPEGEAEGIGSASVSLYRRFHRSGLTNVRMLPDLTVFDHPDGTVEQMMQRFIVADLTQEEIAEWRAGVAKAAEDGTFFLTWPHHCAIGTKPQ